MLRRLRFIVIAGVVAIFAVVTMVSQGYAHTAVGTCKDLGGHWDKIVSLTAATGKWTILAHDEIDHSKSVDADAWMYNGTVPGPTMTVTEGDKVCVQFTNNLPESTSVHFHGIKAPYIENANDGVPPVGAGLDIPGNGGMGAMHFTAPSAGGYMYHAHEDTTRQILLGLYGKIIVKSKFPTDNGYAFDDMWMLSEWRIDKDPKTNDYIDTVPAGLDADTLPDYFTIDGKAFDPVALGDKDDGVSKGNKLIVLKQGQRARLRMTGIGQWPHAMHMHGRNFQVVAKDGTALANPETMNTITVHPGEIYDIVFTAGFTTEDLGIWVFHCHLLDHATNHDVYPGGLISAVVITK
ncbi:MAG: multicopper oxidase domain-containing protein [candidate division NC10 bacterium]|nr:multicopper oxidase domain-containing protein [candidate division NC10 bacterium]